MTFLRIYRIARRLLAVMESSTIENEEFRFRANIYRVRDTGKSEIALGPNCDRPWIQTISFFGYGLYHISYQADRCLFRKRVDPDPRRIGNKKHVRLVDRCPAAEAGSVKTEAIL